MDGQRLRNHFFTMALREPRALDIALRLPPLFLMDQLLLHDMGLNFFDKQIFESNGNVTTQKSHFHVLSFDSDDTPNANLTQHFNDSNLAKAFIMLNKNINYIILPHLAYFFISVVVYIASAFLMTLDTRQILKFYTYSVATLCSPLSFFSNRIMLQYMHELFTQQPQEGFLSDPSTLLLDPAVHFFFINIFIQFVLSRILATLLWVDVPAEREFVMRLENVLVLSMFSPTVFVFIVDARLAAMILGTSLVFPILCTGFVLWQVVGVGIRTVIENVAHKRQFVANFGLVTLFETEWTRLKVPSLLRTFWLTRLAQQLLVSLHVLSYTTWTVTTAETATKMAVDTMLRIGKDLIIRGSETIIAVLGMTSIVSSICDFIGSIFFFILTSDGANENEEEKSVASVSAVLFFVLALQTGLTSLEPDKRLSRIGKNICLLVTAIFHFIHSMVNPVLMSLSAQQSLNSMRHLRALGICAFLIVVPLTLMVTLWQYFSLGTWLLSVSAFCIEVVIKVLVTLSVYALFLYESRIREGSWDGLDDAVYYVKAVGNSIEFCFAVFLFFNGGWILFFESGGTIRAMMMLIHAYCNIWLEAKSGWDNFKKRRTAMSKIDLLNDASFEDLQRLDDVCSICYQTMTSAKMTKCNHYFHSICLRKWLYVQDSCPLCHADLYREREESPEVPAVPIANVNNADTSPPRTNEIDSSESSVSEDEFQDDLLMYTNRAFNQRNETNVAAEDSSNIGSGSEDEEDQTIAFE